MSTTCDHSGGWEPTVDIKRSGASFVTTVTGLRCAVCSRQFRRSGVAATGSIVWSPTPVTPDRVTVTPAEVEQRLRAELGEGPGTALTIRLFHRGVPTCQACKDLAKRMNAWGVAGCRDHLDEIVADVLPRFQKWIAEEKKWAARLLQAVNIVGAGHAAARLTVRVYISDVIDDYAATQPTRE
jgi:hypothetical protein